MRLYRLLNLSNIDLLKMFGFLILELPNRWLLSFHLNPTQINVLLPVSNRARVLVEAVRPVLIVARAGSFHLKYSEFKYHDVYIF